MVHLIETLLKKGIYIGTSSWKYPGWTGVIYNKKYKTQKEFNETALAEYAEHYPTVGIDHTYYDWPSPKGIQKYAAQVPTHFRFGLKVTEAITVLRFPKLPRYGKRSGLPNETFLDVASFENLFLAPLRPYQSQIGPILFEFSHFHKGSIGSGSEFVEKLDRFFSILNPKNEFLFGIEIRNSNWLKKPYFEMLQKHNLAHVFNSWTRMPQIGEQMELAAAYEMPAYIARLLLQPGTQYAEAVEAFSPYDKIIEESPSIRREGAALIKRALQIGKPAFVFVNNRCEGSAPKTIEGILSFL